MQVEGFGEGDAAGEETGCGGVDDSIVLRRGPAEVETHYYVGLVSVVDFGEKWIGTCLEMWEGLVAKNKIGDGRAIERGMRKGTYR
jgi:hypothetical protein